MTPEIVRRTFEAEKYPKGSLDRERLNLNAATSEYMPSHRYAVDRQSFRTKREAIAFVEQNFAKGDRT